MNAKITKELLFNHFMGQTSAMQKQMIDEWVLDKANEELFYRYLEEYENLHAEYIANIDGAVDKYYDFLEQYKNNPHNNTVLTATTKQTKKLDWKPWIAAASVLFVVGLSLFFSRNIWKYQTFKTDFGETKSFQLPDGSSVTLNANSSLKIPRWGFGEDSRIVLLEGEASFSVKHTQNHQKFIVQTAKSFDVEVLGTEFTVFARERGSKVVLSKGKVRLNLQVGDSTQKILMKPGDLITIDNRNIAKKETTTQPEIHEAWRGHRYIFEQTSLQEITYLLSENYGVNVEVTNKELLGLTVSGTFTANNLDEFLELIQGVLDLQITHKENTIFITQ
ncbi:anti-sigma factor [Emticicia aquatilis]|uniref:Anti-sigma factor n=1 Tax=Emticicia aquatilis TaxID=1537369 RepID=A0A916YI39_9BACT|nr:FecR domain-containing protein [Emticicia aquatilis]GGD45746.1 anti-sigma factor [Emticicia aquatilis]